MAVDLRTDAYERLALAEPKRRWELHDGELREKPPMTFAHGFALRALHRMLVIQLDPNSHEVAVNQSRVRRPAASYFIPDLAVLPVALFEAYRGRRDALEVYDSPLPLVVEVWSPSTGEYDVDNKFPVYQARGDLEIWRIHPFEQSLTAWRRQPDGSYVETVYQAGAVEVASLPGVEIDLDVLFAD